MVQNIQNVKGHLCLSGKIMVKKNNVYGSKIYD